MIDIKQKIRTFTDLVSAQFNRDQMDTFWSLETDFRQLIAGSFPTEVMNLQLGELVKTPTHLGDWRPSQVILHRAPAIALALASLESPRQYIHAAPFYAMYAPVGTSALHYTRYLLPPSFRNDVFDPSVKLTLDHVGAIAPGEVLQMHSDKYAYDFRITRPQMVVKLTTAAFQTQEWLFNRDTLRAWQANDSELAATQLRVAAYTLGRLANTSSIEPLTMIAGHTHHTVRWAAIQSLGRLSRTKAIEALERAVSDSHPHVARAALKTLNALRQTASPTSTDGH